MSQSKPVVAIAGAGSYVGRNLLAKLTSKVQLIGLSPNADAHKSTKAITWRSYDSFSLTGAKKSFNGADIAVYLPRTMMSSAKLTQGKFEDMNVIAADNFAQAAKRQGIKEIIYLGGIMPERGANLTRHLESCLEVERILRSYGTTVTALRAGHIVESKKLLLPVLAKLVKHLPSIVLPIRRRTNTQPIPLEDVVNSLSTVILEKVEDNRLIGTRDRDVKTMDCALNSQKPGICITPIKKDVRSVQRVKLPKDVTVDWVGSYYFKWLGSLLNPWVKSITDMNLNYKISFLGKKTLLELSYSKKYSSDNRTLYYITGGLLTNQNKNERGRMEFRKIPGADEVIIAIHDFTPSMPWFIYQYAQASAHLFIMYHFRKHMEKLSSENRKVSPKGLYGV